MRIRLLADDGQARTQLSEPFDIEDVRSIPLRLLGITDASDKQAAVDNALQVRVTVTTWEGATFVEIHRKSDEKPMYEITNACTTSQSAVKIWQPKSQLGEAGAVLLQPGDAVSLQL